MEIDMGIISILIDIVLLAILVVSIWHGYRRGVIITLAAVLALIISLSVADLVSRRYSGEFTSVLDPFFSGIVDRGVNEAREELGDDAAPFELCRVSLEGMGLTRSEARTIARQAAEQVEEGSGLHVYKTVLVDRLCVVAAYALAMLVVFILAMVFFTVVENLINLEIKLPGLEMINGMLGLAFGLIKGLIIVFLIAWVARFSGLILKEEIINKTLLLRLFMNVNPFAGIFGV